MNRLIGLKEWLTLDEAAHRLSNTAKEPVTQADILQLALDDHIQLSVFIDDFVFARDISFEVEYVDDYKTLMLGDGASEAIRVEGLWDLAAYGVGVSELRRLYREAKGMPPIEFGLPFITGLYLHDKEKTSVVELLNLRLRMRFFSNPEISPTESLSIRLDSDLEEDVSSPPNITKDKSFASEISSLIMAGVGKHDAVIKERLHKFYRAMKLPDSCIVAVRKDELLSFESKHLGGSIKAELTPTERASSHQVVAALAAMSNLDLSAPYKAVGILRQEAAKKGLELPSSDETIVKFLAGPSRKKN